MKVNVFKILKGAGMGMAEVVPGVSGGTIAFITGIYEELLTAIRAINGKQVQLLLKGEWKTVWANINGPFLLQLGVGMILGLLLGILILSHLIETFPEILWAFFFGLILASAFYVLSLIERKTWVTALWISLSAVVAFGITELSPAEGTSHPLYIFFSGMIAVSALLLPGLSGSFILLVMGMYTVVLGNARSALTDQNLEAIGVVLLFGLGCILGALLFSRLLVYLFKNYRESTLAVLCGFMLGSLNKIWPWREPVVWMNEKGEIVKESILINPEWRVLQEVKIWPQNYPGDPYLFWSIAAFIFGIAVVLALWKAGPSKGS